MTIYGGEKGGGGEENKIWRGGGYHYFLSGWGRYSTAQCIAQYKKGVFKKKIGERGGGQFATA